MAERLGRYTVLRHLASGGMADVLLARTEGIEGFSRHVVLKRIRAEHAKDQRFIDMFLDEARLAANLHHQNVVQVHDIGEAAGEFFFAMEYLHGEDLRTMLSIVSKTRTHMPLGYVVSVISSVAAGLHYAHERRGPDKKPLNIVHRDVSPSNIFVGYDGSVKVVDFGIAKAAMRQVETRSGNLKGKVSYMSPEQCKLGTIDRRSDVYALGVVLYELATTTRLFKSDSDYLVMDAICTGKIPLPRVRRPDLPNELQAIIMKALATDPELRYQTADEMRVALDEFATAAQLTASASTIASYVHKLCGEKAEPWLDSTPADDKSAAAAEADGDRAPPTEDMGRMSWSALPVAGSEAEAKTITDGKNKRRPPTQAPVVAALASGAGDKAEAGTSTKLGWEQGAVARLGGGFTPARIAMVVTPLIAIAGVLAWKLAGSSDATAPAVAASAPVEPAPIERVPVEPGPAAGEPAVAAGTPSAGATAAAGEGSAAGVGSQTVDRVTPGSATTTKPADPRAVVSATTKPVDPKAATVSATAATTAAKPVDAKAATEATKPVDPKAATVSATAATTATKPVDPKAATSTAAAKPVDPKAAAATTPAKPVDPKAATVTTAAKPVDPRVASATVAPTAVAAPTKPVDPKAAPATPAGPVGDAPIATLAPGVVEQLASRNRKALLACEAGEALHGDLTIRFQINAEGKVVRSAAQSTLGKPKVSDCILVTLRGWRFPKPATGAAAGVYSISFQ